MTVKNDNDVEQLEQMGFSKEQAKAAFEVRVSLLIGAISLIHPVVESRLDSRSCGYITGRGGRWE